MTNGEIEFVANRLFEDTVLLKWAAQTLLEIQAHVNGEHDSQETELLLIAVVEEAEKFRVLRKI